MQKNKNLNWKKFRDLFMWGVKNEESRLNVFLFFFSHFIFFYSILKLGLGLEWQDHTVTQEVTSDDIVTSHIIHGRMILYNV